MAHCRSQGVSIKSDIETGILYKNVFYVASEDGLSNVCTGALDVLVGPKLRAVRMSRVWLLVRTEM